MKVFVTTDEWYPVYSATFNSYNAEFEVHAPQEQVERWMRAEDDFRDYQQEIKQYTFKGEEL